MLLFPLGIEKKTKFFNKVTIWKVMGNIVFRGTFANDYRLYFSTLYGGLKIFRIIKVRLLGTRNIRKFRLT